MKTTGNVILIAGINVEFRLLLTPIQINFLSLFPSKGRDYFLVLFTPLLILKISLNSSRKLNEELKGTLLIWQEIRFQNQVKYF